MEFDRVSMTRRECWQFPLCLLPPLVPWGPLPATISGEQKTMVVEEMAEIHIGIILLGLVNVF